MPRRGIILSIHMTPIPQRESTPVQIVGIDEAGRGPLAGPVVVGAVMARREHLGELRRRFAKVRDSKRLSPQKREQWLARMQAACGEDILEFKVSFIGVSTIDRHGIRFAVAKGIRSLLARLGCREDAVKILLDGGLKAPKQFRVQETIIGGDDKEFLIALASIAAKVARDKKMEALARRYPEYSLDVHKGYGTPDHYKRISRYGISDIHRRSFLKAFTGSK